MPLSKSDIGQVLTGDRLMEAIQSAKEKRAPIAEGFLYEQTINMMVAEPGIGKSTISTQVAIELAAGLPIFGLFKMPKAVKILYCQTERSIVEFLERVEVVSKRYPIVKENLYITDEYQRLNLLNPSHVVLLIECIKRDCPDVKVIFFDPIYAMVSGGLSADEPASAFTRAMSNIQKITGATLYYNHHTVKAQHDAKGYEIKKKDPFYGSQWLKAHVTGYFHMTKSAEGVLMTCKKDNYRLLPGIISLTYDSETELCSVPSEEIPAIERVRNFLKIQEIANKEFYFNDIVRETQLCTRTIRKLLVHSSISDKLEVLSSIKNKNLYKIRTCTS